MARTWGRQPVCPLDGGALLGHADWGDRLHCPNARHGGNGMMFAPGEWLEAVPVENRGPSAHTTARVAEATEKATQHRAAMAAAKEDTSRALPVDKTPRTRTRGEPRPCKCECGGMTKGGTFLPGHDAKYHSRMKADHG